MNSLQIVMGKAYTPNIKSDKGKNLTNYVAEFVKKNKYQSDQSCLDDDTYYNIRLHLHTYKSVSIHPGNRSFIISYLCNLQNGN